MPFIVAPFAAGLLERLQAVGVEHVTFLAGPNGGQFAPLVPFGSGRGLKVTVRAEEEPLDTAGAVRRELARHPDGPVLVCNGDVVTDLDYRELCAAHHQAGAAATIALGRVDDPASYGIVGLDAEPLGRVQTFVEKPAPGTAPSDTASIGTYVVTPEAFAPYPGDGPLSFERDVFPTLVTRGALSGLVCEAYWLDVGTPERYLEAQRAVLAGRCGWPIPDGVEVDGGHSARHEQARVADEAELGPGTVLGVAATVAERARIDDSVLFDHAAVGPGAVVTGTLVGEAARIGAGAHVGPDVVIGDGAVVRDGARVPPGSRVEPFGVAE